MVDRMHDLAASLDARSLHLILMPTEACNFRCTYCYEDFKHGRMAPEIVRGVKRHLTQRAPDLQMLSLTWFGGEPLLTLDIVASIMRHAARLTARHPMLQVNSNMTTNGYLLDRAVLDRLLELGVRSFQVSLDGGRTAHDQTRLRADGGATFDRVWGNLVAMRTHAGEFDVVVRVHVHRGNVGEIESFVEEYARDLRGDARFVLFPKPVAPLGGPNDGTFPFLERAAAEDIARDIVRRARALGLEAVEAEHLQPICYAARGNSFLVRADGRLGKCTVALDHPTNQVGRLHPTGYMEVASDRVLPWMRGLWSGDAGEQGCPKRGLADGPTPSAETRPITLRIAERN